MSEITPHEKRVRAFRGPGRAQCLSRQTDICHKTGDNILLGIFMYFALESFYRLEIHPQ